MQTDLGLKDYTDSFVQRLPSFALKDGKTWRTVHRPLTDSRIRTHLTGTAAVASLPKWYPEGAALDVDDRSREYAEEVRSKLGLDEDSSMLCTSESPDSWHVLFRPSYNGRPPTVRLLAEIMQPFAAAHGVEVFPQPDRMFRLPFGPVQRIMDPGRELLSSWNAKFYWWRKLDEFSLSEVPGHQRLLPFEVPAGVEKVGAAVRGEELYHGGLEHAGSRHEAQFYVLDWLWRKNVAFETAVETCFRWICRKHNGYSKDVVQNKKEVAAEIRRQASRIWSTYTLPDTTHNRHHGFITAADLPEIFKIMRGSLPRARFLYHLLKYSYPRHERAVLRIHREVLRTWTDSSTYLKRFEELRAMGLADRREGYRVGMISKAIILKWRYPVDPQAILDDERAPWTLENTIAAAFTAEEARGWLLSSGVDRKSVWRFLRKAFDRDTSRLAGSLGACRDSEGEEITPVNYMWHDLPHPKGPMFRLLQHDSAAEDAG